MDGFVSTEVRSRTDICRAGGCMDVARVLELAILELRTAF